DKPPPPPSAGHIDREHLNDLLRAFAGLAAVSGSSDGVESDGDERSNSGSSSGDADEDDASARGLDDEPNNTGSESSGDGLGGTSTTMTAATT
ncbi:unnamed protein product, partial [Ectocarpus sp. 8 AP-2014]